MGILSLSTLAWIKTNDRKWIPFIFISAVYGCLLKFTGPVYMIMIASVFSHPFIWRIVKSVFIHYRLNSQWFHFNWSELTKDVPFDFQVIILLKWVGVLSTIAITVALLGIHPYVTNFYYYSSPIYPLHSLNPQKYPVEPILNNYYSYRMDFREASVLQRHIPLVSQMKCRVRYKVVVVLFLIKSKESFNFPWKREAAEIPLMV